MRNIEIIVIKDKDGNEVYSGEGAIHDWEEKLGGKPTSQSYSIQELGGEVFKNKKTYMYLKHFHAKRSAYGSYHGGQVSYVDIVLNSKAKSLLQHLLNDINDDPTTEQGR